MNEPLTWQGSKFQTRRPKRSTLNLWVNDFLRRLLDIVASLIGLLLLSPIFLWVAFVIRRDSPGPILYRGRRIGKNGKIFKILKFRTMYEDASSYAGPKVTAQGDPRITPLGRWLRDTKLNELPQLWNVLICEMALVGPRPEDPEIASGWPLELRQELLSVAPGVTSPASILYRNEESMLSADNVMDDYLRSVLPTKLRLDQLYVQNRGILTDLDVILWTAIALLPRARERDIPETDIFWGPLSRFYSRFFVWFVADLLVVLTSIIILGVLWRAGGPLNLGEGPALGIALLITLLFSIANLIFGINSVDWSAARSGHVFDIALSTGLITLIYYFINLMIYPRLKLPPEMVIVIGVMAFIGFSATRYRTRLVTGFATRWVSWRTNENKIGERVLVIGAGEGGRLSSWLLQNAGLSMAFSILGAVDDDPRKSGMTHSGLRVLGNTSDIPNLVKTRDIGLILYAISRISADDRNRILSICKQTDARVLLVSDFIEAIRREFTRGLQNNLHSEVTRPINAPKGYISEEQVNIWLEELENASYDGNPDTVRELIYTFRKELE